MELSRIQTPGLALEAAGNQARAPSPTGTPPDLIGTAKSPLDQNIPANGKDGALPGSVASVIVRQDFPPNTRLHFDEASNRIVAQFLDENNEVVRQVPPQELLDISARFNRLEGILFDQER